MMETDVEKKQVILKRADIITFIETYQKLKRLTKAEKDAWNGEHYSKGVKMLRLIVGRVGNFETALLCLEELGALFNSRSMVEWRLPGIYNNCLSWKLKHDIAETQKQHRDNMIQHELTKDEMYEKEQKENQVYIAKYNELPDDERTRVYKQAKDNAFAVSKVYANSVTGIEFEVVKIMKGGK